MQSKTKIIDLHDNKSLIPNAINTLIIGKQSSVISKQLSVNSYQ